MKQLLLPLLAAFALAALPGCMSHAVRVEPIAVAPMHVTMDVNLHVDDERAPGTAGAEPGAAVEPSAAAEPGAALEPSTGAEPGAAADGAIEETAPERRAGRAAGAGAGQ